MRRRFFSGNTLQAVTSLIFMLVALLAVLPALSWVITGAGSCRLSRGGESRSSEERAAALPIDQATAGEGQVCFRNLLPVQPADAPVSPVPLRTPGSPAFVVAGPDSPAAELMLGAPVVYPSGVAPPGSFFAPLRTVVILS